MRHYIDKFDQTGYVEPKEGGHGPMKLHGDYEHLILLQMIMERPGIYLLELQNKLIKIGVLVSVPTICRTLKFMGCTGQSKHHVAIQRSDILRARFMTVYDLVMLIWLDEMGCDGCYHKRKYGYSICKLLQCDRYLLVRGIRYKSIPVISMEGVHDVYPHQGYMNGDSFFCFVEECVLLILLAFNWHNPRSAVVTLNNANIHHVQEE